MPSMKAKMHGKMSYGRPGMKKGKKKAMPAKMKAKKYKRK